MAQPNRARKSSFPGGEPWSGREANPDGLCERRLQVFELYLG